MRGLCHKGVLCERSSDAGVAIAVPVRDRRRGRPFEVDVSLIVGVAIAVPVRDRRGSGHFEVNVSLMVVRMFVCGVLQPPL